MRGQLLVTLLLLLSLPAHALSIAMVLWRGETRATLNSNGQWDEAGMLDGMRQVIKALPPPAP